MNGDHVHLSLEVETARAIGSRRLCQSVTLEIDTLKIASIGIVFSAHKTAFFNRHLRHRHGICLLANSILTRLYCHKIVMMDTLLLVDEYTTLQLWHIRYRMAGRPS
jgi:hypothetical protein